MKYYNKLIFCFIIGLFLLLGCASKDDQWIRPLPKRIITQEQLPNANAVFLLDEESFKVIPQEEEFGLFGSFTGLHTFELKTVIVTILNKQGLRYASWETPWYYVDPEDKFGGIIEIKGRVLKPNGEIVLLKPENIYEVDITKYLKKKHIAFPGVEPGCVIQLQYIIQHRWRAKSASIRYLQYDDPVLHSHYYITLPTKWEPRYNALPVGYLEEPDIEQVAKSYGAGNTYHWYKRNIPEIEYEPFMPSLTDLIPRVTFSLYKIEGQHSRNTSNWENIGKWFYEAIQNKMNPSGKIKELAKDLTKDEKDIRVKIKNIFYWIQSNYNVGIDNTWVFQKPDETIDEGKGTSGDIACLLISMLKASDIQVEPVLISTKENGKVDQEVPTSVWFNRIIVRIPCEDSSFIWLDPAAKVGDINVLPYESQGVDAFILSKDSSHFEKTPIAGPEDNAHICEIEVSLKEDGSAAISYDITFEGEIERGKRIEYTTLKRTEWEVEAAKLCEKAVLKDYSIPDPDSLGKTFKVKADFDMRNFAVRADTMLFFSPFSLVPSKQLFPKTSRIHPVVFDYKLIKRDNINVTIPKKYKIVKIPTDFTLQSPHGRVTFKYQMNGKYVVRCEREVILDKLNVSVNEYEKLRDFYTKLCEKEMDKIILSKIIKR